MWSKGHKSYECPNGTMVQGVDSQEPWVDKFQVNVDTGSKRDACCVESSGGQKSWHVGAIQYDVPYE
eukprot:3761007-Karenia_brevis.AAC.1